jgi:hypothetical protein
MLLPADGASGGESETCETSGNRYSALQKEPFKELTAV